MAILIPFTRPLPPRLPTIEGNVDYRDFEHQLQRIDLLLAASEFETQFLKLSLDNWQSKQPADAPAMSPKQQAQFQAHSRGALRGNILRTLLQLGYRKLAVRLADSPLLQWFAGLGQVDQVTVPGKSTLHRYETWVPEAQMRPLIEQLLRAGRDQAPALHLEAPLDLDTVFLDCTCVKADIHFPVDWVLLRDATRTLMQAVHLIREQGLKHRMAEPAGFITRMNRLCIQMTHTARLPESKKQRKQVLRHMKQLTRVVRAHAQRYRDLLDPQWERTDWTRPQTQQVRRRLDNVLSQLPGAVAQAHALIMQADRFMGISAPGLALEGCEMHRKLLSAYDKVHANM